MTNMRLILRKSVLVLTLCGMITAALTGCDAGRMSETELATVDAVTENLLTGIEEKDYKVCSRDFSDEVKAAFGEEAFRTFAEDVAEKLGEPQSREVVLSSNIQQQGEAILSVVYEVTYEKDPTPVKLTIQAQTKGDTVILTGMSFESPVLE